MATAAKKKLPPRAKRKIFIVEDHPVFREGLVQILNQEKDLVVCGEAADVAHAFRGIARLRPDLALVDITLPGKSGLELIKELRRKKHSVKILVISMHDEAIYANRVLRAGGDGYIMKQEDPSEIVHAVRDVLNGHVYVSEQVFSDRPAVSRKRSAAASLRPLEKLTDAELELLEALGRGMSSQDIARLLQTKVTTVNARCARIRKKLKVANTNALICFAACRLENQ